jgi:dolichol-phosphate mannosyltransferase
MAESAVLEPVLVVVPTYNEKDNLEPIIARLQAALPQVHALVVDDGSPDGTGDIADKLAASDDRVHVMHRTAKNGLGAAYLAGFAWGLEHGYQVLVEMDADGSHAPEDLHRLLDRLESADLVLGSRYIPGGKVVNWPKRREVLSKGANVYAKLALGVPINDITGGFRAYRRSVFDKVLLSDVESAGYCFQVDMAWRTVQAGLRVAEVPITFVERVHGVSKMSGNVIQEAMLKVASWGVKHRIEQVKGLFSKK